LLNILFGKSDRSLGGEAVVFVFMSSTPNVVVKWIGGGALLSSSLADMGSPGKNKHGRPNERRPLPHQMLLYIVRAEGNCYNTRNHRLPVGVEHCPDRLRDRVFFCLLVLMSKKFKRTSGTTPQMITKILYCV
jgi:hypothetical protein